MKRLLCLVLTVCTLCTMLAACVETPLDLGIDPPPSSFESEDTISEGTESHEDTDVPSDTTVPTDTTTPLETNPPETEPIETQAPETDTPKPVETTPPETKPIETQSPETEAPKPIEPTPPETQPAETEPPTPAVPSTFSIHFIDVGQADAALVECDGHYMLIDGGNKSDSSKIYSILKSANIKKLDIVIGTHAHEDHIGGLPGAFNYTTVDLTLCPVTSYDSDAFGDFKKYADKSGSGITVPNVGDEYTLGSATIKILGVNGGSEVNDTSIVLKIVYGDTSFLFTGDAERDAEQKILNSGADLSATVLKVGHHGSDSSTTYPFLREIMPKYAVISVGDGNSYGHPTDNTLSRLRDADVKVFRTDLQGDIYCTSDGKTVTMSVERNANADTLKAPSPIVETKPIETEAPETQAPSQAGTDYILNTNTKKFHYPSCRSVKQMSEKNKEYFTGTRDELIQRGFSPCGNCDP